MSPVQSLALRSSFAIVAMLLLPASKGGCNATSEKLNSPVQAVTTLLQRSDGKVDAELVLISTAVSPNAFVDTARNAAVRVPSGDQVTLTLGASGHYDASSTGDPKLVFTPGQTYQFRFDLDDAAAAKQVAGGSFVAVVTPADDTVSFQITKAPKFAGDTASLTWAPASRNAIIEVRDGGGKIVFSSFDFTQPEFDGSKWARLPGGGSYELPVDAFATAGTYSVGLCAVVKVSGFDPELSQELGPLSGFLTGRCAASQSVTVAK